MKRLLKYAASVALLLFSIGCTNEPVEYELLETLQNIEQQANNDPCVATNPEARITNNGTVPVNLDILNENDDVVGYVHNLLPGETSVWLPFPPGDLLFSVSNDFVEDEKVIHNMTNCMIFDMEVGPDNKLTDAQPESI